MLNFCHRGLTYSSCWEVDDASQCLIIIGVDSKAKIAYGIFNLLALVEREPAIDAIGDGTALVAMLVLKASTAQGLLEHARLGIGAVEHSKVIVAASLTRF